MAATSPCETAACPRAFGWHPPSESEFYYIALEELALQGTSAFLPLFPSWYSTTLWYRFSKYVNALSKKFISFQALMPAVLDMKTYCCTQSKKLHVICQSHFVMCHRLIS
jgi:hypothetical protein